MKIPGAKIPGTDVKQEEIEAIRLLEAEKIISADTEQKLADLHEKVKLAAQFMQKLEDGKEHFNQLIAGELRTGQGDVIPTLNRLKEELRNPAAEFDAVTNDVQQLIADAGRVFDLVNDLSGKEGRFRINIKGRNAIKHWHSLNEEEKRQVHRNIVSLGVLEQFLSSSQQLMLKAITLIDMAVVSFNRAKQYANGSTHSKALLSKFLSDFIKELSAVRNQLQLLERTLGSAKTFIERFRSYLNLEEKESKEGKAYIDLLMRIQAAGKTV